LTQQIQAMFGLSAQEAESAKRNGGCPTITKAMCFRRSVKMW